MLDWVRKPMTWFLAPVGLLLLATMSFAIFQPVKVVPRIAAGPSYTLTDQTGQPFTDQSYAGKIVLYGFGYTSDPTGVLDQTLADMQQFQAEARAQEPGSEVALALVLFDDQRDTTKRRRRFAAERGLDLSNWALLGGDADSLKRMIGQGLGIYYEQVPLGDAPGLEGQSAAQSGEGYGYLQAERYVLVDDLNVIRAEYRSPLDMERLMRDVRLIIREKNSSGAERALNEAAHLFLCYPD